MRDAAEVMSGPHPSPGVDRYLIKKADGNVSLVKVSEISEIDSRRDMLAEAAHKAVYFRSLTTGSAYSVEKSYRIADAVIAALDSEPAAPRPLADGDRIRILRTKLNGARVAAGDVLTVRSADYHGDGTTLTTDAPRDPLRAVWYFRHTDEGTGWERA
ncbi:MULTISPECIES: hypothetical protein [Streptomyces]|uniref:hypothetical protein n=1 Tax=Streptomyces TaxID=1883 RepID=UPI0016004E58|nr:hypothetical protein [Streptomyces murinus]MBA9050801.1 hypothetical protein [Streptomyces murinus]